MSRDGIAPDQPLEPRHALLLELKLEGASAAEISQKTGLSVGRVRNLVCRGGSLRPYLDKLRQERTNAVQQGSLDHWEKLLAARGPAVDELVRVLTEEDSLPGRLKACELVVKLTGPQGDVPPTLDPSHAEQSLDRFGKWTCEYLAKGFGVHAPAVRFQKRGRVLWASDPEATPPAPFSIDPVRMAALVDKMAALNRQLLLKGSHAAIHVDPSPSEATTGNLPAGLKEEGIR